MIDKNTINVAEFILAKGDRVELIPVKDGVKVVRVRRDEVKKDNRSMEVTKKKAEV